MPRQADRLAGVVDALDGVPVEAEPGWRTRGYRSFAPRGFTIHHDASPRGSSARHIIRDGRAGLSGPLAHLYLERDGTLAIIAAGRANHAGRGGWRGLSGNRTVWGLEIANDGSGEPYSDAQMHAVIALCRAFVDVDGVPVELIHAHHEWAPTRKIDPSVDPHRDTGEWDMDRIRADVRNQPADDMEEMMAAYGPPLQIVADENDRWYLVFRWDEQYAYIASADALKRLTDRAGKDDRYAETRTDWQSAWFEGMEQVADR